MPIGKPARGQRGFTYLGVLFLVALMGLGLSGVLQLWSIANQRAHERELLWVGEQYARALQSYYLQSPGTRTYPRSLDDLVVDNRFPTPRRHLRKLYADPVTRSTDWGLIKAPDGGIAGVHSLSTAEPWKKAEFARRWEDFKDRSAYAEWRFVANVGLLGENKPAAGVAAAAKAAVAKP